MQQLCTCVSCSIYYSELAQLFINSEFKFGTTTHAAVIDSDI